MSARLRIGSRKSPLAVRQAEWVGAALQSASPGLEVDFVWIVTSGDRGATLGGKGVFVKEIEEALLAGQIDCAVHSLKDVPQSLPEGLVLADYPRREDPREAVVARFGELLAELPKNSTIGTSSPRRRAQIMARYPERRYRFDSIRGNVGTRLNKLQEGQVDAILLAAAGLRRLGLDGEATQIVEIDELLPPPGQGCLGLELRAGDRETAHHLSLIAHAESTVTARAERAFLSTMNGDCRIPLAGHARLSGDRLRFDAELFSEDGTRVARAGVDGLAGDPEALGRAAAEALLASGGGDILRAAGRLP